MGWLKQIDLTLPCWADCLPLLQKLDHGGFPNCDQLNALLPGALNSHGGHNIRFVPSTLLAAAHYEHRIFTTGQVSTRPDNWHDLFNALMWVCFPSIKKAMNALHYRAFNREPGAPRGKLRDALTLFDECGVIVFANDPAPLGGLSERRWGDVFQSKKFVWGRDLHLAVVGHAILEKYLSPYKSLTAKALLVQTHTDDLSLPRNRHLRMIDMALAKRLLNGDILDQPARLTPLPLAGIPGWWIKSRQDERFYDDPSVFRPAPANLLPAGIIRLS